MKLIVVAALLILCGCRDSSDSHEATINKKLDNLNDSIRQAQTNQQLISAAFHAIAIGAHAEATHTNTIIIGRDLDSTSNNQVRIRLRDGRIFQATLPGVADIP